MKKRTYKGSFTLEAAVIIPLTMALIAALLIFALAVHDGVIMNTVTVATIMENAETAGGCKEYQRGSGRDGGSMHVSKPGIISDCVRVYSLLYRRRLITTKHACLYFKFEWKKNAAEV